jgi:hypothetical protein
VALLAVRTIEEGKSAPEAKSALRSRRCKIEVNFGS